ncbi:MAG: gamma-glutamyltransferase [Gammaproteobacteria bacterium]|nr:gamma-glutamyltransferase [Gammaproteobacteria bacterium]
MKKFFSVAVVLFSQLFCLPAIAELKVGDQSRSGNQQRIHGAGIASAHPYATRAGIQILKQGGNAFDAAIAVTAALAVVEPTGSGLGGGGFWLLHDSASGDSMMVDGREKAPLAATRDMYLDKNKNVIPKLSVDGALAAGIPGEPAALAWMANKYGTLPLSESLKPAIRLAEQGFPVGPKYYRLMKFRLKTIQASQAAADIFLDEGKVPSIGHIIVQRDLAKTLKAIARDGHDGFYQGEVAEKLVKGVRAAGGIWTMDDLAQYQVQIRKPVTVEYKGMKITSAALPSSGGLVLAQSLNILSGYDMKSMDELDFTHLTVEAMRRAYRDRAQYMGDEDFVTVPKAMIVDQNYAHGLRQSIRLDMATPSDYLSPTHYDDAKGQDTTHFSIIDGAGNRVSATLSINYPFGSGVVAPGTGVLLNDEMDDFSSKPGVPNVYGLVGAEANAIEPGKRMLSSMSPTFLETNGRVAVLGTPGGSRIISMVLLAALEFHKGAGPKGMVLRPRFHHQYLPDSIQYEPNSLSEETLAALIERGHELKSRDRTWGNMHAVVL